MRCYLILLLTFSSQCSFGQFGPFQQNSGYVTVREGAHMFFWLFYTTANVSNYTDRPLIIWLQGGPGTSSSGLGNFKTSGPLDPSLQERNNTWVKNFNILFVDNPVGTGFSYVDKLKFLAFTNDQIALDFVVLMRGFFTSHPEFQAVPLYIYGHSYGGKMAVDIGIRIREAEQAARIRSNLKGIAMGNPWISPVDSTLSMAPLLLSFGLVDREGHDEIQTQASKTAFLFNEGSYAESSAQWATTQQTVLLHTINIDFYNVLTKMHEPYFIPKSREDAYVFARDMLIRNALQTGTGRNYPLENTEEYNLNKLMNIQVKEALGIPKHVVWGSQSQSVFNYLRVNFMKPVTKGIEKLLNETDIILTILNGNLDLVCNTPGQILWVDRLNWVGAKDYMKVKRKPLYENNWLEGYYKSYGNFRFFWINNAGHNVPIDNPAGINAVLRDMTKFG